MIATNKSMEAIFADVSIIRCSRLLHSSCRELLDMNPARAQTSHGTGIRPETWFESTLSTLPEATAVAT